jgi:hypothetical protein
VAFYKGYIFDRDTERNREIRFLLCVYDTYKYHLKICKENQTEFWNMENLIWEGTLIEYGAEPKEMPNLQQVKYWDRLFADRKREEDNELYTRVPIKKYA